MIGKEDLAKETTIFPNTQILEEYLSLCQDYLAKNQSAALYKKLIKVFSDVITVVSLPKTDPKFLAFVEKQKL